MRDDINLIKSEGVSFVYVPGGGLTIGLHLSYLPVDDNLATQKKIIIYFLKYLYNFQMVKNR